MSNLCNTCIHEEVCGLEDHGEAAIKYCVDHYPKPIHCKHCWYGIGDDPYRWCTWYCSPVPDNGHCHHADRRVEE